MRQIAFARDFIGRHGLAAYGRFLRVYVIENRIERALHARVSGYERWKPLFERKRVLEIGGPSGIFAAAGRLPVYAHAGSVDNCNFAGETLWERPEARAEFRPEGRVVGRQEICEATLVDETFPRNTYDLVMSSHCLEHTANPLKALKAWAAVARAGGALAVIVPKKSACFDHRRPTTTFEHLKSDFALGLAEDDKTHLEEILALHDLSLDFGAPDRATFEARARANFETRGLHHHVFDLPLLREAVQFAGAEPIHAEDLGSEYIVIARKPAA